MDQEKINIIMICVYAQIFTNNHRLLWNSPSWRQVKIRSADRGRISLPVYYFFCLFKNRVKLLQEELKLTLFQINIISLVKRIFHLFIYRPDLITWAEAVTPISA